MQDRILPRRKGLRERFDCFSRKDPPHAAGAGVQPPRAALVQMHGKQVAKEFRTASCSSDCFGRGPLETLHEESVLTVPEFSGEYLLAIHAAAAEAAAETGDHASLVNVQAEAVAQRREAPRPQAEGNVFTNLLSTIFPALKQQASPLSTDSEPSVGDRSTGEQSRAMSEMSFLDLDSSAATSYETPAVAAMRARVMAATHASSAARPSRNSSPRLRFLEAADPAPSSNSHFRLEGVHDSNLCHASSSACERQEASGAAEASGSRRRGSSGSRIVAEVEVGATPSGLQGGVKLGGSAVWDAAQRRLMWVDTIRGKVFIYDPESRQRTHTDLRQVVGGVVPYTEANAVVAVHRGICVVSLSDGRYSGFIGNPEWELPENTWTGAVVDPRGRLWVGSKELQFSKRRNRKGALWSFVGGEWVRRLSGIGVPNGMAWSSDGKTFWLVDTPSGQVDAFDVNEANGAISNRRAVIVVDTEKDGHPYGCAVDVEDTLWIAMWGSGQVIRYDPSNGEVLLRVPLPKTKQATSCAFGGDNLDQLFVTTASCGDASEPFSLLGGKPQHAGALFRINLSGTGIRGLPATLYGGSS